MDAELKAKWVEALRSGEYEQEQFGIGDKHVKCLCCLGVGAVVANQDIDLYETECAVRELQKYGFPEPFDGNGHFAGHASRLIEMNDIEGKSFAEIADYIEANL